MQKWQSERLDLNSFDADIRQLKNHTIYIQAALAYLDGIRTRWQLYLDGQRVNAIELRNK